MLKNELCQVFKTENVHFGVLEVDMLRDMSLPEMLFACKNGVPDDLPERSGSFQNILLKIFQLFPDFIQVLVPMERVLVKKFDDDLAHIIRQNEVFKKVWNFIDIRLGSDLVQLLLLDVLKNLRCRRSS